MRLLPVALLAIAIPLAAPAQQGQQGPVTDPVATSYRNRIGAMSRNLAQAFDSIPESLLSYKPTPAQQTFGYIAQHHANDNYLFCGRFGPTPANRSAEETSTPDSVKATWPKAKLVSQLKASFAFCEAALATVTDANIGEMITIQAGGQSRQTVRSAMLLGHAIDLADHYSQVANYMRLNQMLPPTALPRPRP